MLINDKSYNIVVMNWLSAATLTVLLGFFVQPSHQFYAGFHPVSLQEMYSSLCDRNYSMEACPSLPTGCCCVKYYGLSGYYAEDTGTDLHVVDCYYLNEPPKPLPLGTQKLFLRKTRFEYLDRDTFNRSSLKFIGRFELTENPKLKSIGERMFTGLKHLRIIIIKDVENLEYISGSAFSGTLRLGSIQLTRTGLKMVHGFNDFGLGRGEYIRLTISHNQRLTKIQRNAFRGTPKRLHEVKIISNPALKSVEDYAFNESSVTKLILNNNEALTDLSPLAFADSVQLELLSFKNTRVRSLPTAGLQQLTTIYATNVPTMIRLPDMTKLPGLKEAQLTYSYHCCAFSADYGFGHLSKDGKPWNYGITMYYCDTGEILVPKHQWWSEEDVEQEAVPVEVIPYKDLDGEDTVEKRSRRELLITQLRVNASTGSSGEESKPNPTKSSLSGVSFRHICYKNKAGELKPLRYRKHLQCTPHADAFNPCEDLLGSLYLAGISWCVAWLSVIGNLVVLVTLAFVAYNFFRNKRDHLTVSKFLILNLSLADLLLGTYILSLALMDGKTTGSYYRYGVEWQTMSGCGAVGFLAVLSSQQSILTLAVISVERWYAIRNAIHLEKRIKFKFAAMLMGVIWIFCIILAVLPLAGINGYTKSSICLPFDVKEVSGLAYVGFLLFLDVAAFCVVLGCYISMYFLVSKKDYEIRSRLRHFFKYTCLLRKNVEAENRPENNKKKNDVTNNRDKDARIARSMAVLIFTDFACFFPICLCSLFAVAGLPIISLSTSKILLVVFFPINSCFNPFLYAILTKSFKKDFLFLFKFLKQISFKKDQREKISSDEKGRNLFFILGKKNQNKRKEDQEKKNFGNKKKPCNPQNKVCEGAADGGKGSGSDPNPQHFYAGNTNERNDLSGRSFDHANLTPTTDMFKLSKTSLPTSKSKLSGAT